MTAQDAAAEKEPENAPQEMNYYSVGDGQGIVHWLGRGCGTREWKNPVLGNDTPVRLLASSCAKGELWMITDWKFDAKQHDYQSKDDRRSWVAIDFKNYEVCPAVYSMAHDAPRGKANYLRSWKLQGSNDLKHWTALDTRTNDEVLCSKDPWVAYATPELSSYYQYIRIVMEAEGNTRRNNVLTLNCFEVYGKVRRRKDIPKPVERKPASKPNNSNANGNGNAAAKGYSKGGKGSKGADFEGKGKGKGRGSGAAAFLSGGILPPWGAGRGDFKGGVKGAFKGGKISARGDMPVLGLGLGKGMKGRGSVMLPAANSKGIERRAGEATCPNAAGTKSFTFEKLNDNRGILFYLGCQEGAKKWANPISNGMVTVAASSVKQGEKSMVTDYKFDDQVFFTKPEANSWVQVSLKKGHKVIPTKYVFSHRAGVRDFYVRTWTFEGSNDGEKWKVLSKHTDDESFNKTAPTAAFDVKTKESFSSFRIQLAENGNSKGTSALVVSCFEVYGALQPPKA